jgi:hypothetical protein
MSARPAPPTLDTTTVDVYGDGWVNVIVVRSWAVPPRRMAVTRRRTRDLVEKRLEIGSGKQLVTIPVRHRQATIA